jgi:hypothetical protein
MESVSIVQNNKTITPTKPATPYNPCGSRELTTARASFTSILPPVGTSTAATSLGTWVSDQKTTLHLPTLQQSKQASNNSNNNVGVYIRLGLVSSRCLFLSHDRPQVFHYESVVSGRKSAQHVHLHPTGFRKPVFVRFLIILSIAPIGSSPNKRMGSGASKGSGDAHPKSPPKAAKVAPTAAAGPAKQPQQQLPAVLVSSAANKPPQQAPSGKAVVLFLRAPTEQALGGRITELLQSRGVRSEMLGAFVCSLFSVVAS